MLRRILRRSSAALLLLLPACGLVERCSGPDALDQSVFEVLYSAPAPAATGPLQVYHLGHSLVGHDMPAMLAQLAGEGHGFASQIGSSATLRDHWEPDAPIQGLAEENTHPQHRAPREALESGAYDAIVLTEAVENREAVQSQASEKHLATLAAVAWESNPGARVYLYETWPRLGAGEDWLDRLELDLERHWESEILRPALARQAHLIRPIYVIPGGQVMAAFVRKLEEDGGIGPLASRNDLFSDDIHLNDHGAYLMALTHYAVLYGRSPVGLPHALKTAEGGDAADPGIVAARAMQEVVWDVVRSYPPTGAAGP